MGYFLRYYLPVHIRLLPMYLLSVLKFHKHISVYSWQSDARTDCLQKSRE